MTDTDRMLLDRLPRGPLVVICGRPDDAVAWRDLIGHERCLALSLDNAPRHGEPLRGASVHLDWQHRAIEALDDHGWLHDRVHAFDPHGDATLIVPDPLDPPTWGERRRIGARHPGWRQAENKTIVDSLWDTIGLPRSTSIVADLPVNPQTLAGLAHLVDEGHGAVCSRQPIGTGPTAGGDGIWWWPSDHQPPTALTDGGDDGRLRIMPLLAGLPVRLHGLVLRDTVLAFPPKEVISLPQTGLATFLLAGTATLDRSSELEDLTRTIGCGLRTHLGFRGGFSVDGVLTTTGFRPTDLNARLTSAMEAAPPAARVRLHAVNLLAREGAEPPIDAITQIVNRAYANDGRHTLYGAARTLRADAPSALGAVWCDGRLLRTVGGTDVTITAHPSPRGWLITAALDASRLPAGPVGLVAPAVFRFCDDELGTDFGALQPAFGLRASMPPVPRRGGSAELVQGAADPR